MADIHVRKLRFTFDPIEFEPDGTAHDGGMFTTTMGSLGISLTMPYLEPYLIRTMKVAASSISDPRIAADVRSFSQQEGHHYRNHANFNNEIRAQLPEIADDIRGIESALEADYQRFSREESLRFNLVYAEGFEAMTCALALASASHDGFKSLPGGELWAWHMAEEIEHRTVAFEAYDHLVGSYFYRIGMGTWAQRHYVGYINRFAQCIASHLGRKLTAPKSAVHKDFFRRYLRTWSPFYHPAKLEIPPVVGELLARYDALAAESS